MQIVEARPEHLQAIASIYGHEVATSASTFDLEPPTLADWKRSLAEAGSEAGHRLVVALDDSGAVLGFAKSGKFRDRAAYDFTCETSIYVEEAWRGNGVGKALYGLLLDLLESSPLRVAIAVVTEPNPASTALHESLGFTAVGTFEGVGYKFGRPWSVTWFRRPLS